MSRRSHDPLQKKSNDAARPLVSGSTQPAVAQQKTKHEKKRTKSDDLMVTLAAAGDLSRFSSDAQESCSAADVAPSPGITTIPRPSGRPLAPSTAQPTIEESGPRAEESAEHVPAMQAAARILSENASPPAERHNPPAAATAGNRPTAGPGQTRGADAVNVLRNEMRALGSSLRDEFRQSVAELQSAQAAAITAQSEVLRTLTEMIYTSSASTASREISPETLERAFAGIEQRLFEKFETVVISKPPADLDTSESGSVENGRGRTSGLAGGSPREGASPVKQQKAASTVNRSWEQIRSEMISDGELGEMPEGEDSTAAVRLPAMTQLTSERHFRLPEQDLSLEIPKCVDPETLSDQDLREAFRERETFISTLIARIRRQQDQATGQLSPEQLRLLINDLPDELADQVRHTLRQMEELARMGELELSLERARIARQVNHLEHSRMTLERNARQMGMELKSDGTLSNPTARPGRGSSSRRWLGKLGFGP